MPRLAMLLVLTACGSADTDVLDTDTVDTDAAAPPCTALPSATYVANGACFGMRMTVDVTMDEQACTFTLDNWSMNHGNSPTGGVVVGDEVTLAGGDFDGCAGTIDGDAVSGTCDDGCAWELAVGE